LFVAILGSAHSLDSGEKRGVFQRVFLAAKAFGGPASL
jgi:hypothetical protein